LSKRKADNSDSDPNEVQRQIAFDARESIGWAKSPTSEESGPQEALSLFHDFRNFRLATVATQWDNRGMTRTSPPEYHEQRRIEKLLIKLSRAKAISAEPAQRVEDQPAILATGTSRSRVFYST
jgi:hypothetical protein